jgi:hypothetical protein
MRLSAGLAAGFAAACIAGCSVGGAAMPSAGAPAATASRGVATSMAPPAPPASPSVRAGARAAASHFYDVYSARQFAAAWSLLATTARRQVSRQVWLSVHDGCAHGASNSRVIKAVTVFGNAAIVTAAGPGAASKPDTTEDVFSYTDGRWLYSPGDLSIYLHGSVAADIAAARAAGNCASWKVF